MLTSEYCARKYLVISFCSSLCLFKRALVSSKISPLITVAFFPSTKLHYLSKSSKEMYIFSYECRHLEILRYFVAVYHRLLPQAQIYLKRGFWMAPSPAWGEMEGKRRGKGGEEGDWHGKTGRQHQMKFAIFTLPEFSFRPTQIHPKSLALSVFLH